MVNRHVSPAHIICRTLLLGVGLYVMLAPIPGYASLSPNFQIQEDVVGGGGNTRSTSPGYISQDSLGDATLGPAAGTGFGAASGFITPSEATLSFSVDTSSVNLGSLSTSLTRTGTATFSVTNYTSYGYVVQTIGNPPNNGSHTLTALSSQTASATNTEQFGINLTANTAPTTFGAAPQQVPDNSFGFGSAATGYNTANVYKYVSGDTIAGAVKSSGKTTFSISYVANIAPGTERGSYSGNQTLVCTGTY
ncbi:MAG TPA: hypothetical protein VM581_02725 [Magnetospirillaceae bacterium]|nr:hypothetical protein [Magnetospirillaceae bacterium]